MQLESIMTHKCCVFIPFLTYPKFYTNNVPGKDQLCQVGLNIVISHVNMQWHHAIMMAGGMWKAEFLQFKFWDLQIMAYYLLNLLCVMWLMWTSKWQQAYLSKSSLFIIYFPIKRIVQLDMKFRHNLASFHCKPVRHSFFCKPQKKII